MFIDEFKEDVKSHKVKFINEKKDRVMVLHIENLTKPLCQVFPKRLDLNLFIFNFLRYLILNNIADFKLASLASKCQI